MPQKTLSVAVLLLGSFFNSTLFAQINIGGVDFPQGSISFADQVIEYDPAFSGGAVPTHVNFLDPKAAIGQPDYPGNNDPGSVSLGSGGRIVLRFTDNILIGSDNTDPDLHIVEIGSVDEDAFVEISQFGAVWHSVGTVANSVSASIDIDAFGFDSSDEFRYVRITDDPNQGGDTGEFVGSDIDAVGAITTKHASVQHAIEIPIGRDFVHLTDNKPTDVYFNLFENDHWDISSDEDWIEYFVDVSTDQLIDDGTGDAFIYFRVAQNNTGTPRKGTVIIETNNISYSYTVAQNHLPAERTVYGKGDNTYGETFADGTFATFHTPSPMDGYTGYKSVQSNSDYTLFLKNDGTLSRIDSTSNQAAPETIATDVASMDMGLDQYYYITNGGTLNVSTINSDGAFPGTDFTEPTAETVATVIAGPQGYYFITTADELWGVGYLNSGRLGTGRFEKNSGVPVLIASDVSEAAMAERAGAYLTNTGELWAASTSWSFWFGNTDAHLTHFTFEQIDSNVREIEATTGGLYVIKNDNTLHILGRDSSFGYEPDGIELFENNAASISISTDLSNNDSRIFVENTSGETYGHGLNVDGELGTGSDSLTSLTPNNPDISQKFVGTGIKTTGGHIDHTLFVNNDSTLSFSGKPPSHLANSDVFKNNIPTGFQPLGIDDISQVSAGPNNLWLLTEQEELLAIGANGILHQTDSFINFSPTKYGDSIDIMDTEHGLLTVSNGNLEYYPPNEDHPIQGPSPSLPYTSNIAEAIDVATTENGIFWVEASGNLYGIGLNFDGTLGTIDIDSNVLLDPQLIDTNVNALDAGEAHLLYTKNNGTLWAIGEDDRGQLGNGEANDTFHTEFGRLSEVPVKVADNVEKSWASNETSLYLANSGTLWAAGFIIHQSSTGSSFYSQIPINIASNVIDAALDTSGRVAAVFEDGRVREYSLNLLTETIEADSFSNRKAVNVDLSTTSTYVTVSGTPSLDTTSLSYGESSDAATIGIDFNDPWIAFTTASWILLDKELSDGTDTSLNIVIEQNTSPCPRTGTISIGGSLVEVTQLGTTGNADCSAYVLNFKTSVPTTSYGTVSDAIQLTWTDQYASLFQTTYELWRATDNNFSNAVIVSQDSTNPFYRDLDTVSDQLYYYWLRAYRDSFPANFVAPVAGIRSLPTPEDVKASQGDFTDRIRITWPKSAGATSYAVYRAYSGSSSYRLLQDGITATQFDDLTADPDTIFDYRIASELNGKLGPRSLPASGYQVENGITTLRATDGLFDDKIRVTWDAFEDATTYALYRSVDNDSSAAAELAHSLTTPTYEDPITEENQGVTYYYWVIPTVNGSQKSYSNSDQGHVPVQRQTSLVAWGDNTYEQSTLPDEDLIEVIEIAAGVNHSLALRLDGTVIGWGRDEYGQATPPSNLTDVIDIAVGYDHSLALKKDGTVVAWGRDTFGKATVPNIGYVIDIEAGADHSLALLANGTIAAWGGNDDGQTNIPANLRQVVEIAAGGFHNIARKADGSIAVWGDNTFGQLNIPDNITTVIAVASGWNHLLVITPNYIVRGWGDNSRGQLNAPQSPASDDSGRAHIFSTLSIKPIAALDPFAESTDIVGISGGLYHSLALTAGGDLLAWGDNHSSQTDSPVTLSNVSKISAGDAHNMALGESAEPRIENIITGDLNPNPNSDQIIRVRATGGADLEYQWYRDGVPISESTTDTLVLTNLSPTDAGNYTVKVTSNGIEIESDPVTLTITGLILKTANIVGTSIKALLGAGSTWLIEGIQTDPANINIGYDYNGSAFFPTPSGQYTIKASIKHDGYVSGELVTLTLSVQNVENNTRIEYTPANTTIHYLAADGYKCILKTSTDMLTWTTLETIQIGDGTMRSFTQPSTPGSHFRVSYETQ